MEIVKYVLAVLFVALIILLMGFTFLEPTGGMIITSSRKTGFSIEEGEAIPEVNIGVEEELKIENASENVTQEIVDSYTKTNDALYYVYIAIAIFFVLVGGSAFLLAYRRFKRR